MGSNSGDFLTNAQPVFSKYEILPTVYLVPDFVDRKYWPWFSKIEYMITQTRSSAIQLLGRELIINNDRLRLAVRVTEMLTRLPNIERMTQMEVLQRELRIQIPVVPPPEDEALTWDDVRSLAAEGVEFGSHTRTHRFCQESRFRPSSTRKSMAQNVAWTKNGGLQVGIFRTLSGNVPISTSKLLPLSAGAGFRPL